MVRTPSVEESRPRRQSRWRPKVCDVCGEHGNVLELGTREYHLPTRHYVFEIVMNDALCERCGFVFSRRIPQDRFLFDYYRDSHTLTSELQTIPPDFDPWARIKTVRQHLSDGSSILEIGAGTGDFCDALRSNGFRARGFDPLGQDAKGIVAKGFAGGRSSSNHDPKPIGPFDAVVSYYVLEHVVDARRWLLEAKSYLSEGGLLIIEVPNYWECPAISLNEEHFLHFSPPHLEMLLRCSGFETLEANAAQPSRNIGFVTVARLRDRTRVWDPALVLPISNQQRQSLTDLGKQSYLSAKELMGQEYRRLDSLAKDISARALQLRPRPTKVYFWGANHYATYVGSRLIDSGLLDVSVVDNSLTKIGTLHEGFERPISAPVFAKSEPFHRVFVLCSRSWNWQIREQIGRMDLKDISVIDIYSFMHDC